MTSAERRDRALYVACFVALCVASLLPVWRARLIPLLDQPNHLAAIQIWNKLSDPSWGFDRFYAYSRVPVPYWGYYLPVHLLSYACDVEIANKLFLSAYVLSMPSAMLVLSRALGASPVAALLVVPFTFNDSWAWGFLSFVPGIALLLFGLAVLVAYYRAPSAARAAGFFAILMATYFMHFLPWAALCVLAVVYSLGQWPKRRAVIVTWALLGVSALACVANTLYCSSTSRTVKKSLAARAAWESPLAAAKHFVPRLASFWPKGEGDLIAVLAVLLAIVVLVATSPRRPRPTSWHAFIAERFAPIAAGVGVVLYFTTPIKLIEPVWIWHVNTRYAVLVPLFLALCVRGELTMPRRAAVALAVVASVAYAGLLSQRYVEFNVRAQQLFPLFDHVPRGSSTLTLLFGNKDDPALDPEYVPYNEFHSYPAVMRGGFNPYGWTLGFPFTVEHTLPTPFWNNPHQFSEAQHGRYFDFVITFNEAGDKLATGPHAELVARSGPWRLYRTKDRP